MTSVNKKEVIGMAAVRTAARLRKRRKPSRSDPGMRRFRGGYGEGYRQGVTAGIQSFPVLFEGTSIVIPTYNQLDMVRQCIYSIIENTDLPYEIIVVDNASTDGTSAYLQSLGGQVRFKVLERNRGFAGAINVGLMMAKGSTIVLLNNDTLLTENWLDQLLACLNSDDQIGMVGPVTNYISGDQKIAVPYDDVRDMPEFARSYNGSNPAKWQRTDRLIGFCLLFRRELFEAAGYFDEGYEIGNFEDDDFNIRVRMMGKKLVIARDTFIHHFGSVSMKALGDKFQEVNDRNHHYFIDKWQNPYKWLERIRLHPLSISRSVAHASFFYPEKIAVQGIGANVYWIEDGQRRLVDGVLSIPAVKVSQVDLKRWPLGCPIDAEEANRRWNGGDGDSGVLELPDGTVYHLEGNVVRRMISASAMRAWQLHLKPSHPISPEEIAARVEGLPILPPPVLKQTL